MASNDPQMSRYQMQIQINNHVYDTIVNALALADIAAKGPKSKVSWRHLQNAVKLCCCR